MQICPVILLFIAGVKEQNDVAMLRLDFQQILISDLIYDYTEGTVGSTFSQRNLKVIIPLDHLKFALLALVNF